MSGSEMKDCNTKTSGTVTEGTERPAPGQVDRRSFREKLLVTALLYYIHSCEGLILGSGGPAFLDLIQITKSDVEEASIFFTAQYLGGSVSGMVFDRFKPEPLMFAAICLTSGLNIAIPYCSASIWLMAVVNGLKGAMLGILFTGLGVSVVRVWGKKDCGPYMQAHHFAFSIGAVIAPFIMKPFLSSRYEVTINNQTTNETLAMVSRVSGEWKTENNLTIVEYYGETHVQYGFIIIGLITLTSAFPFLVMILRRYHLTPHFYKQDKNIPEDDTHGRNATALSGDRQLTVPLRVAFLIVIVLLYILMLALDTLFQNYSMTFVVEHLKWTKTQGTLISSVYLGAFSFGRFQGIFTAKLLTAWKMLVLDFIFLSSSVVVLVIGVEKSSVVVWISLTIAGIFTATLYATGISYTQQRIMSITGKIYAIFVGSSMLGAMVNPLILGTLIENFSPMWFVYLSVIITGLCVTVFSVLSLMVLKWGKQADPGDEGILDRAVGRCITGCRQSSVDV